MRGSSRRARSGQRVVAPGRRHRLDPGGLPPPSAPAGRPPAAGRVGVRTRRRRGSPSAARPPPDDAERARRQPPDRAAAAVRTRSARRGPSPRPPRPLGQIGPSRDADRSRRAGPRRPTSTPARSAAQRPDRPAAALRGIDAQRCRCDRPAAARSAGLASAAPGCWRAELDTPARSSQRRRTRAQPASVRQSWPPGPRRSLPPGS